MAYTVALTRRLIMAGGFAVAMAAGPAVAAFAAPAIANAEPAACAAGEEADQFTGDCVPHTVPNSPAQPFSTIAGNPDMPAIDGIPCSGANSGQCIGLAEDAPQFAPPPESTVSSSPTVYGVS
jgi:hypothetical protein